MWARHGIRILPGPSSLWLDADRQPAPGARCSPASTPSEPSSTSARTGHDHSWFVLTQKIIEKEFTLSGSEQNPDFTEQGLPPAAPSGVGPGAPGPVEAFKEKGADFVVAQTLA